MNTFGLSAEALPRSGGLILSLSQQTALKLHGRQVAEGGVEPLLVIDVFEEVVNLSPSLR